MPSQVYECYLIESGQGNTKSVSTWAFLWVIFEKTNNCLDFSSRSSCFFSFLNCLCYNSGLCRELWYFCTLHHTVIEFGKFWRRNASGNNLKTCLILWVAKYFWKRKGSTSFCELWHCAKEFMICSKRHFHSNYSLAWTHSFGNWKRQINIIMASKNERLQQIVYFAAIKYLHTQCFVL